MVKAKLLQVELSLASYLKNPINEAINFHFSADPTKKGKNPLNLASSGVIEAQSGVSKENDNTYVDGFFSNKIGDIAKKIISNQFLFHCCLINNQLLDFDGNIGSPVIDPKAYANDNNYLKKIYKRSDNNPSRNDIQHSNDHDNELKNEYLNNIMNYPGDSVNIQQAVPSEATNDNVNEILIKMTIRFMQYQNLY